MKKWYMAIGIILVVGFTFLGLMSYNFKKIEQQNVGTYYKKEQVMSVFYENQEIFNRLKDHFASVELTAFFYNANLGKEQLRRITNDEEVMNDLFYVMDTLEFNSLKHIGDYFAIYQNKPTIEHDIQIGLWYHYIADENPEGWSYQYQHYKRNCSDTCGFWYQLYDSIYNKHRKLIGL